MELFAEIQKSLNQIAPSLLASGRASATEAVHHAFEDLAFRYADDAGLAFGTSGVTDPASKNPDSVKRIVVYSSKPSKWPERDTQRGFLFDHCWLVFYNSKAPIECNGCLAGCELAMESEFTHDIEGDSKDWRKEYAFFQDFRKLLITNARAKVFVFQSRTADAQKETFRKMQAEITSFGIDTYLRDGYLLCGWCSGAFSYKTISG